MRSCATVRVPRAGTWRFALLSLYVRRSFPREIAPYGGGHRDSRQTMLVYDPFTRSGMNSRSRSRRRVLAAVTIAIALGLGLAACSSNVPNTTLSPNSEVGREIDAIFQLTLILGAVVFVGVQAALIFTLMRFRARNDSPAPRQVHGNTTLEIAWTLIPAIVLAFIAVPSVRTIFTTYTTTDPNALQVEVVGRQWWWEFRYPQYNVVTANELYLPVGRTVNFELKTADVIHSFWIPQMSGKRDLITNKTNFMWFTPESSYVWNGFCTEYCGASHANMRLRAFTVAPEDFDRWIAHQQSGPMFTAAGAAPAAGGTAEQPQTPSGLPPGEGAPEVASQGAPPPQPRAVTTALPADVPVWPMDRLPAHTIPRTPIPRDLAVSTYEGDPARGEQAYRTSACIGCHVIGGVSFGVIGPNLTHVGSRSTIAAGQYLNDARHMTLWLKNAPRMKPGSLMPAMGAGIPGTMGNLNDQQLADIAAYLLSLK